jgi:hypothetical protein
MMGRKVTTGPLAAALCSLLLFVPFSVTALASAQNQKKTAAPPPQRVAPAKPTASAPRPQAQRPGASHSSAQQPGKPGGANANRATSTGANKSSPPNANRGNPTTANKGAPANANRGSQTGTKKGTPANANRASQPGTNRGTPANANKGNQTGANKGTPAGANRGNQTGANKGTPANANRGSQTGTNRGIPANANKNHQTGANRGTPTNANKARPTNVNRVSTRHQPAGSKTVALKGGGTAVYRPNGQVRVIQTKGMTINRGIHGSTRIVSTRHGTTVVGYGRGGGYSQRSYYNHGGRIYVQRTYYSGGRYYAYGYRSYTWGGRPYYGYAPPYYWGPRYYGWAYNPWPAPVYYSWGWGPAPWYGYYGPYFAPYPVYPTAAFWLTDYLIAANLQAAYAAQQAAAQNGSQPLATESENEIAALWTSDPLIAANPDLSYAAYRFGAEPQAATGNATQLTSEVKQAIADEMKQEIAAEQAAAASGKKDTPSTDQVPAALDPKIRIFVVSTALDLTTAEKVECPLTPGDVVYRIDDKPDDDGMVNATVKSSKKDECAIGATVAVDAGDLQEMHNQLRIQMDAGLKELAEKQGKNGIPSAPDTKTQAGEVPPPKPDDKVESELQQQQKEAAEAEAEAQPN